LALETRNWKKICCPKTFKLSIIQENKWEVGQALEATLLIPLTIPPLGYGWIYYLLSRPLKNHKQYEIIINGYLAYNCMDFFSMMSMSFGGQGPWVQSKHLYYILQYAMFLKVREPFIHPS
jgi:hypothetical protein